MVSEGGIETLPMLDLSHLGFAQVCIVACCNTLGSQYQVCIRPDTRSVALTSRPRLEMLVLNGLLCVAGATGDWEPAALHSHFLCLGIPFSKGSLGNPGLIGVRLPDPFLHLWARCPLRQTEHCQKRWPS